MGGWRSQTRCVSFWKHYCNLHDFAVSSVSKESSCRSNCSRSRKRIRIRIPFAIDRNAGFSDRWALTEGVPHHVRVVVVVVAPHFVRFKPGPRRITFDRDASHRSERVLLREHIVPPLAVSISDIASLTTPHRGQVRS